MDSLTIILLVAIGVFIIGNILLSVVIRKQKKKRGLPLNSHDAKIYVLKSKMDVLHSRVSRLESEK